MLKRSTAREHEVLCRRVSLLLSNDSAAEEPKSVPKPRLSGCDFFFAIAAQKRFRFLLQAGQTKYLAYI